MSRADTPVTTGGASAHVPADAWFRNFLAGRSPDEIERIKRFAELAFPVAASECPLDRVGVELVDLWGRHDRLGRALEAIDAGRAPSSTGERSKLDAAHKAVFHMIDDLEDYALNLAPRSPTGAILLLDLLSEAVALGPDFDDVRGRIAHEQRVNLAFAGLRRFMVDTFGAELPPALERVYCVIDPIDPRFDPPAQFHRDDDSELLALDAEYERSRAALEALRASGELTDERVAEHVAVGDALARRMAAIPARTPAGLRAKARVILAEEGVAPADEAPAVLLRSLFGDLRGLG